jgi:uncharacterized membrane protein YbhN (UPF0104 family)
MVRRPVAYAFSLGGAAVVVALAATVGRATLEDAVATIGRLQPGWLLLAGLGFGTSLVCSARAWHAGLRACGGRAATTDVTARYAVGSLVNSFTPAHAGGALRIGLLARTLDGGDAVLRTCGVGAAVGAARALGTAVLVVAAAAGGRLPLWPAPIVAAGVVATVVVSSRLRGRLAVPLAVFRSRSARLDVGRWIALSFAARLGGAIAVAASLGIPRAVAVALVLLAAMALAGVVPVTPGNIGAGAGAAALALHGTGMGSAVALALGMTFQAVETCTAILLGLAGSALLAAPGTRMRRWSLAAVAVGAIAVAATVGVVSVDLV